MMTRDALIDAICEMSPQSRFLLGAERERAIARLRERLESDTLDQVQERHAYLCDHVAAVNDLTTQIRNLMGSAGL